MFFLHRASIYWICTPCPTNFAFLGRCPFWAAIPQIYVPFPQTIENLCSSGIYKSIGSWFSGAICIALVNMRAWAGFAAWQERGIGEKWEKPHYLVDATGRKEILLRKWSQDELPWHQFRTPSFVLGITKFIKVKGWSSGVTPSHDHCQQYWPWCHRPFHLVSSSKKTKTHCHGSQYVPWQRCLCQRFCERKSCGSTSALNEILSIFGPRENVWRPRAQIIVN